MRSLFLCFILWTVTAQAAVPEMNFTYVPNEAGDLPDAGNLKCEFQRIRDLPDWKVSCGAEKTFTAHVVIRSMQRDSAPQTAFEILFWVTEPGESPNSSHKFHSTTAILELEKATSFSRLVIYQGVENDQASLKLEVRVRP